MNHHPIPRARSQAGSAYIIALLVLVVLTLLGLGLAVVTQTEVQIGANELTTHRALYGAEGGMHLAMARVLTLNDSVDNATLTAVTTMSFATPETRLSLDSYGNPVVLDPADGELHFAEDVDVSPFVPIRDAYCDGCPAGEGDVQLLNVNHVVVATARRVSWLGADQPDAAVLAAARARASATKELYLMIGFQPWWPPKWAAIADPEQLVDMDQEDSSGVKPPTP
jgi:hypothetical protein